MNPPDKFDVFLQYGQLDYSNGCFFATEYINNENYGCDKIIHNISAEEAAQFCINHGFNLAWEKEIENSHLKNFKATCFWTIAQED